MPPRLAKKTSVEDDLVSSSSSSNSSSSNSSSSSSTSKNSTAKDSAKDSLIVSNYTEKSVVVTGDTISHSNELKKLGGKYNPKLKTGPGWIFSKTREPAIQKYIETGEIEPYKAIPAPKSDNFTQLFEDLKKAFNDDEEYDGKDILETIKKIEEKYCGGGSKTVVNKVGNSSSSTSSSAVVNKVDSNNSSNSSKTSKVSASLEAYHESDSE
jgi:hypothetical protein